jgi:hypothetical protein
MCSRTWISVDGSVIFSTAALWSLCGRENGRELFYFDRSNALMPVLIELFTTCAAPHRLRLELVRQAESAGKQVG